MQMRTQRGAPSTTYAPRRPPPPAHLPPGLSTLSASRSAAGRSVTLRIPNATVYESKEPEAKGSASALPSTKARPVSPARSGQW